MPDLQRLGDLPAGTRILAACRVSTVDTTTGTVAVDLEPLAVDTQVRVLGSPLQVGDIARNRDGDTRVVMWVDDDGTGWSSSDTGSPRISPDGWYKIPRSALPR